MKLLIVGNYTRNLVVFRSGLITAAISRGWRVQCVGPESDPWSENALKALGASFERVPMARSSINPIADLCYFIRLKSLLLRFKPDCVLSFTHKPNIYSALSAGVEGVPVIMLVEGLGYAFVGVGGIRRSTSRLMLRVGYRFAIKHCAAIVFLNRDDSALISRSGIDLPVNKTHVIDGIGVDLERFTCALPSGVGPLRFLMVARLLKTKGVEEFIAVASRIRRRSRGVEFILIGDPDPGADSIDLEKLKKAVADGDIQYRAFENKIEQFYKNCDVYVLPSHREGMPVTIMEAMAAGRPIITCDTPGCRNTVNGNGFLIPVGDTDALEAACEMFVEDRKLVEIMGRRSRSIAIDRFDVKKLSDIQMELIEKVYSGTLRS